MLFNFMERGKSRERFFVENTRNYRTFLPSIESEETKIRVILPIFIISTIYIFLPFDFCFITNNLPDSINFFDYLYRSSSIPSILV
jgi:hypothetical protein